MESGNKEVYFFEYCSSCEYSDKGENDDPCDECLEYPVNQNSHKPVNWKKKDE